VAAFQLTAEGDFDWCQSDGKTKKSLELFKVPSLQNWISNDDTCLMFNAGHDDAQFFLRANQCVNPGGYVCKVIKIISLKKPRQVFLNS